MKRNQRQVPDRSAALFCALALLVSPSPGIADEFATVDTAPEDCLVHASLVVNPGEPLTIQLFDGRRIDGKLVSFDLEKRLVTMEHWDELGASRSRTEADEVQRYEYSERSGNGLGVAGAFLGSVVGVAIGWKMTKNGDEFMAGLEGAAAGGVIGGGLGYAAGRGMSAGDRPAGAITCGER